MLEKIPIKERTKEQHLNLMKLYGGARNYFLSLGEFKVIPLEIDHPVSIKEWNDREKYWIERERTLKKNIGNLIIKFKEDYGLFAAGKDNDIKFVSKLLKKHFNDYMENEQKTTLGTL